MHHFSDLFDKVPCMFWTGALSVIIGICHVFCWLSASMVTLAESTELEWQIPIAYVQCWDTPDDEQWTCPKHVEYFIK
jgi:hypothetical protein